MNCPDCLEKYGRTETAMIKCSHCGAYLGEVEPLEEKLAAAVARAEKAEADRDRLAAELELMKNCGNCDEHVDCGYVDVCYYGPANLVEDHWRPRKRG
jgi:hypothetical protein